MSTTYTDPVKEKILDDLAEALTRIKKINGYLLDIEQVARYDQDNNNKDPQPCIIITTGEENPKNHPSETSWRTLTVFLDLWAIHDRARYPLPTDKLLNYFSCDMERAIMADETRNGRAARTDVVNVVPFDLYEGQAWCGVIMQVEIYYSHIVGDPRTQH